METDPPTSRLSAPAVNPDGQLFFEVDARHVRQLGQQLVGDRVTALVELVKNAYDADATSTVLEFTTGPSAGDPTAKGKLVITDDGSGMSLDTLKSSWMRIASADKEANHLSPIYRRTRAGRKGIGRFAVESLGERLTLWSSRLGDDSAVIVTFEWSKAYMAGQALQAVANDYSVVPSHPNEHGTRLEIEGLHAPWTKTQRAKVSRALLLLQPPFSGAIHDTSHTDSPDNFTHTTGDPGFRVSFIVNGEQEAAGSIDEFLAGETAHITADLNEDGRLTLNVHSELLDFSRQEELPSRYLVTGPFELTAAYFVYRKDAIGVPVRAAQAVAAEFGGVRLYRDGLRLLPYGERNDDWLGLDASSGRREVLVPVGNQNFFAQVLIGREANPLLEDTSSREGLLKNEAFEELVRALRDVLITAATWVAEHRHKKTRGGGRKTQRVSRQSVLEEAYNTVTSALLEQLDPRAALAAQDVVRAALDLPRETASAADAAEQDEVATLQNELELLRILASLGTSIAVFSHEVRTLLTATSRALIVIEEDSDMPSEGLGPAVVEARDAVHGMTDLAKYIDSYTSAARERGRAEQPMLALIEDFIQRFGHPLAKQVTIKHRVEPVSLRTAAMGRTTIQAILINLFTNAVKAMDAESHPRREVLITAEPSTDGRMVVLQMQDTGRGVPESMKERLFDAFATDSPVHALDFGAGTGLGLKVVADLAEQYGGEAVLSQPQNGYVTCLRVTLPRWKEQIP